MVSGTILRHSVIVFRQPIHRRAAHHNCQSTDILVTSLTALMQSVHCYTFGKYEVTFEFVYISFVTSFLKLLIDFMIKIILKG